jgi:hypothetical protein
VVVLGMVLGVVAGGVGLLVQGVLFLFEPLHAAGPAGFVVGLCGRFGH